jgi:hypothetical protein
MIGFYVSGHPLDGLKKYCTKRSHNTKKLTQDLEELKKIEDGKTPPPLGTPLEKGRNK